MASDAVVPPGRKGIVPAYLLTAVGHIRGQRLEVNLALPMDQVTVRGLTMYGTRLARLLIRAGVDGASIEWEVVPWTVETAMR